MAQILGSFPAIPHKTKYPYDEWLDGKVRRLVFNEDFTVKPNSMRTLIYAQAKKREVAVQIVIDGDDVIVQAFPREMNFELESLTITNIPSDPEEDNL